MCQTLASLPEKDFRKWLKSMAILKLFMYIVDGTGTYVYVMSDLCQEFGHPVTSSFLIGGHTHKLVFW